MNPTFEQWISEDQQLNEMLVRIQSMDITPFKQAELAFSQLAMQYDLPLMPEDVERYEKHLEMDDVPNKRSVYEEAALLRFLEPEEDPRGIVLFAVYNVKYGMGIDLEDVFKKNFKRLPKNASLGIKGEGIDTSIIFLKDNDSWFDLECKIMLRLQ